MRCSSHLKTSTSRTETTESFVINSLYGGELTANFKLLNQIIAEESAAEIDNSNKKSADDEEKKLIQETGDRVVAGKVSKSLLTWMEAYLIIDLWLHKRSLFPPISRS